MLSRTRNSRQPELPFDEKLKFEKPRWKPVDVDDAVRDARRCGAEDGRAGVPARNDLISHRIESFKQAAESALSAIGQDWSDMHRSLHGEWARLNHIHAERQGQLRSLKDNVRMLDAVVRRREATCDERRTAIDSLLSHERHRMRRLVYILGMAAVFLIDVPLNIVVFNVFGESPLLTYILAGLLGILVVPAAHVLGIQLRNRINDRVIATLAAVIPLALIFAIAFLRKDYLQQQHALAEGLTGGAGVVIFLAFNLAIFGSGIFLSYLRHDPFGQALEEAERALRKAKAEWASAAKLLEQREQQVAAIGGRLSELRAWAEEEFVKARHRVHTQRNAYEQLMHEYAGANKVARKHTDEPVRILDDPSLWDVPTVPPDLSADCLPPWRVDKPERARARAASH
jgi:hypothetical protein